MKRVSPGGSVTWKILTATGCASRLGARDAAQGPPNSPLAGEAPLCLGRLGAGSFLRQETMANVSRSSRLLAVSLSLALARSGDRGWHFSGRVGVLAACV